MRQISALEQKIRDYVNHSPNLYDDRFKGRDDEWNALCVAMDTLGDSCLALEYYEGSGIGEEIGERYLHFYGLFQAVFLQQNSIRQLYRTFVNDELKPHSNSAWTRMRDLRNLSVGHPIKATRTSKGGNKRCYISRLSIHHDRFQLMIWDKDKRQDEFEDVDLKALYQSYKSEAIKYLKKIHEMQIDKWGEL